MAKRTEVATLASPQSSLLARLAERFHVDAEKMMTTLKATAFKGDKGAEITNEQLMALCVVADQYGLNPWTKEIYAFPDKKGGIIPVVGVDGWIRIINSNPQFDAMTFAEPEEYGEPIDDHHKDAPEWIECTIHRKDRSKPTVIREYLDECYRPPFIKDNGSVSPGPWQTHTKRMLRHKALIQCARVAFGFVGIYDPDEAERIVEREIPGEVLSRKPSTAAPKAVAKEEPADAEENPDHLGIIRRALDEYQVSAKDLCEALGFSGIPAITVDRLPEVLAWIEQANAPA